MLAGGERRRATQRSMLPEIQELVDDLADDLDRAVVVEDERHALIAHSPHRRHVDPIRERSVFLRQTPAEMVEWVTRQGLREAEGPLRLPPNPELGAESRVSVPIRTDGLLIGFVTVLDAPQTLGPEAFERCDDAARALARLLHDLRAAQHRASSRERELVDVLLSPDAGAAARERAGAALVEDGRLPAGTSAAVVVIVRPAAAAHDRLGEAEAEAEAGGLIRRARRAFSPRGVAATTRPDHGALVVPLDPASTPQPAEAGAQVAQALAPLGGSPARRPRVAFGDAAHGWPRMAASHRRACLAARVADAIEELDAPAVGWDDLGVFQLLAQVPAEELGRSAMDERIRRLADKPELLLTLAVYLDVAGEAKRAADELALHRASLYYRLHRIEELAGIDLRSGADRLAAHLSIGALRLAGLVALPARA